MRTWTRVVCDRLCGRCGERIRVGEQVQLITYPHRKVKHELARCSQCADGEVPPDLPANIEKIGDRPKPVLVSIGSMAKDWKRAQGGDQ